MRTSEMLIVILAMTAVACFAHGEPSWDDLPPACSLEASTNKVYLICVPEEWNYDVIVYSRNEVLPSSWEPTEYPYLPIESFINNVDGSYLWNTVMSMGYALIATSYGSHTFYIEDCYDDTLSLIEWFLWRYVDTDDIITLGSANGGLVAAKFCSDEIDLVSGCITIDSALGSYQDFINHIADTRTVLDYFYPDLLPGSPIDVPDSLYDDWFSDDSYYQEEVADALLSDFDTLKEIYSILDMYFDEESENVLDMFFTTFSLYLSVGYDIERMGCVPYTNMYTQYTGSSDDRCFNKRVARFETTCPVDYDTSVNFGKPVFAASSTRNPVVPNTDKYKLIQKMIEVDYPEATYPLTLISTNTKGHNMVPSDFIQTLILEMEDAAQLF